MKKLIYCALALAAGLFATSCQQENLEPVAQENTVTFTVETPEAIQTKAIADGMNVDKLIYEVWLTPTLGDLTTGAQKLYQETKDMHNDGVVNKTVITLDLVNDQKYTVLLWAQKNGTGVYNTTELNDVHYNSTKAGAYAANDERLAAFYGVAYVKDGKTVTKEGAEAPARVELRRPFAQVNLGTLNTSTEEGSTTGYTISIEESNMILKQVPTHFNVVNSEATVPADLEFLMYTAPMNLNSDDAKLPGFTEPEYWYAGMNYVFASNEATGINVELTYNIKTKLNGENTATVNNTIYNVPLKENYRTNIIGNLLTSSTDYEVVIDARFNEPSEEVAVTEVTNNEDFQAAIKQDLEHIIIDLSANSAQTKALAEPVEYFIEVGANQSKYYLGGESTKSITINANGNKINFVQHNSDWNYVRLANPEAKLIINDALLTNSGKNTGHWKRNLIRFQGPVDFSNIVSDKGLCMMNDAVLNDIDITVADENYALWITAQGQTVTVDGLDVVATNKGRGIKIADEDYEAVAESINLNVENAKFVTAKKAAVLVTSVAGADINWGEGNNINDVVADPINAVWVDSDREDSYDLVTVTGAIKVLEGSNDVPVVVTNADELKAAIEAAPANGTEPTTIYLKAGTYTGCFDIEGSRNVILTSNEDAVIDGLVHGNSGNYITLKGLTLTNETPAKTATSRNNADGYCVGGYANCFHIEDCTFNVKSLGAINIYAAFNANKEEFELTVLNSTFNCNGFKSIRCKTNTKIDGCTFNDQERYSMQFQANSQAASEKVVFTNNTVKNPCLTSGQPFAAGVQISHSQLCEEVALTISGNTLESELFSDLKFAYDWEEGCSSCLANMQITTCSLNGNQIVAGQCIPINNEAYEVLNEVAYTYDEATSTYTIYSARGLKWLADTVNAGNSFSSSAIQLGADIDLNNVPWTPIGATEGTPFRGAFDGNNHTISNLYIRAESRSGLFGYVGRDSGSNDGKVYGAVRNLKVCNVDMQTTSGAAVVGNLFRGEVSGIELSGLVKIEGKNQNTAGVVGYHYGNLSDITVNVSEGSYVKSLTGYCGGVASYSGEGDYTKKNITSNIDVIAEGEAVGGLFALAQYGNKIDGCSFTGDLINTAKTESHNAYIRTGAIVGTWVEKDGQVTTLTNCTNKGTVIAQRKDGLIASLLPHDGIVGLSYSTSGSGELNINGKKYVDAYKTAGLATGAQKEGYTVFLSAGPYGDGTEITHYTLPSTIANNVTIQGVKEAQLDFDLGRCDYVNNFTLQGVNVNWKAGHTSGFGHSSGHLYKDVTFNGAFFCLGQEAKFYGCTFNLNNNDYVWTYGSNVDFEHCVFNCVDGKGILVYNEGIDVTVNIKDCEFSSSKHANTWDGQKVSAIEIDNSVQGNKFNVNIKNCISSGGFAYDENIWRIKQASINNNTYSNIYINGESVIDPDGDGLVKNEDGVYLVLNAKGLATANTMMVNQSMGKAAKLALAKDIDFTGYTWTPVDSHVDFGFYISEINGNGHTISNLTINGQAMFRRFAGTGDVVVKDITFDNAKVNSSDLNTSILTVQSYQNVLLDNVDVKNSTINGSYKVAPLIATVYNESSTTITATLKNCDIYNTKVHGSLDFMIAGMVAFVNAGDNDAIVFENCTISEVELSADSKSYNSFAAVYTTGSESLYNEVEGVTVTNVTIK